MEAFFSSLLEDIRHERSIVLLIIANRSRYFKTKQIYWWWINYNKKNLALEKIHRQKCLKEYFASQFLE